MQLEPSYPIPEPMPNGLQWTEDGLYVMGQKTDFVFLLGQDGSVKRAIPTITENGSGITVGDGFLWTASNGATVSRPYRSTDTHMGWVLKLDLETGALVDRWRTPDGGGIHGVEWDDGLLWVTAFNPKSLILVDPKHDFKVAHRFPVELPRLHGLARDGEGIWCAHTSDKVIVKYHVETGAELDRITFPEDGPYPHGLSIRDGTLWYSDANFGGLAHQDKLHEKGEIGRIAR